MIAISPRLSCFLDAARWIAAAAVVVGHTRALMLAKFDPTVMSDSWRGIYFAGGFGHAAVIIFFVLSGFLIGGDVCKKISSDTFDWRDYAISRFARLYPVYLAALILGGSFDWIGLNHFNASGIYSREIIFPGMNFSVMERLTGVNFSLNLIFLQEILTHPFGSNKPLWSLAYEAWYYALFPLVIWPISSPRASRFGRIAVIILAAAIAWFIGPTMLIYFGIWLIGLLPHFWPRRWLVPGWVAFVSLASALASFRFFVSGEPWSYVRDLMLGLSFALCIQVVSRSTAPAPRIARLHHTLAGFSYSLYLTHWPLLLLLMAVLNTTSGLTFRTYPAPSVLIHALGLVAVAYLWAYAMACVVEHRTPALRAWMRARTSTVNHHANTLRQ